MAPDVLARIIESSAAAIRDSADHLTELDQAIGDGDHGINMRRGFEAVEASRAEIAALPLPEALRQIGMTLVMRVGGASGPLYGSLFMAIGKVVPEQPDGLAPLAAAVEEGVRAVMQRGKSAAGEKTMLEVLAPVAAALRQASEEGADTADLLDRLRGAADHGVESTRDMLATKGRASYLGERSIGHIDPGARSSQILVHCVCDAVAQAFDRKETEQA
jgi:dihydroxyacetone kinase-like protein